MTAIGHHTAVEFYLNINKYSRNIKNIITTKSIDFVKDLLN